MEESFAREEIALRRKFLFRMLKGFDFSSPRFRPEESISDPLPEGVSADWAKFYFQTIPATQHPH